MHAGSALRQAAVRRPPTKRVPGTPPRTPTVQRPRWVGVGPLAGEGHRADAVQTREPFLRAPARLPPGLELQAFPTAGLPVLPWAARGRPLRQRPHSHPGGAGNGATPGCATNPGHTPAAGPGAGNGALRAMCRWPRLTLGDVVGTLAAGSVIASVTSGWPWRTGCPPARGLDQISRGRGALNPFADGRPWKPPHKSKPAAFCCALLP